MVRGSISLWLCASILYLFNSSRFASNAYCVFLVCYHAVLDRCIAYEKSIDWLAMGSLTYRRHEGARGMNDRETIGWHRRKSWKKDNKDNVQKKAKDRSWDEAAAAAKLNNSIGILLNAGYHIRWCTQWLCWICVFTHVRDKCHLSARVTNSIEKLSSSLTSRFSFLSLDFFFVCHLHCEHSDSYKWITYLLYLFMLLYCR